MANTQLKIRGAESPLGGIEEALGPSRVKILPGVRASEMSDNTRRWPKATETFSSVTRFVIVI